jgi:hypothetical protein
LFVLTVISDSYMGIFLPPDISKRISKFLDGNLDFPFVDKDEIMGVFFLFGKNFGVKTNLDISYVKDLARRSIDQVKREIFLSKKIVKSDIELIKENYQRRVLQIYVEFQDNQSFDKSEINERINRDPSILISCYSQHIAYYDQKCFFEIFDPLKKNQIDEKLHDLLLDRMVMIGYNCKNAEMLPFNTIVPFLKWIKIN